MNRDSAITFGHYSLVVVLAMLCVGPIYVMIMTSLKDEVLMFSRTPVWFFFPTLSNYNDVLFGENFLRYLINSVIIGLGSTVVCLALGGLAAYAIARKEFFGRGFFIYATLLIRMVPPAVMAVPIFALWGMWGLDQERMGLSFFYIAMNLPFTVWLLYSFVQQIPVDLEEAAVMDGASQFQVFYKVIFPLMKSGYAVAAIFTFRIAWNEFLLALILTDRYSRTMPVAISLFLTDEGVEWGRIMAMGSLLVIPPLVLTFFAARHIIQGLTAGAVKG